MRRFRSGLGALVLLCLASALAFAFDFPPLTGGVVDQAGVMTPDSRSEIAAKSKDLEEKSSIQLVVATVSSLQGGDIETYANELFRAWKLGQVKQNNGVLLLVAPAEHKVRIEVGYGLEGTLTDALASTIIAAAIIPRFESGDFSGGIERGVDGIISVLNGDTAEWQPQTMVRASDEPGPLNVALPILGFLGVALVLRLLIVGIADIIQHFTGPPRHYVKRHGRMVFVPVHGSTRSGSDSSDRSSSSWSSSSDSSDSSSSSDSFSGVGGSSGGGGASGSR
jgi:uncharacterized protein